MYPKRNKTTVTFECNDGDLIGLAMYCTNSDSPARFYFDGFYSYIYDNTATTDIESGKEIAYSESKTYETTVTYGEQYELITPVRKGYTFEGWFCDGVKIESGAWEIDKDSVLVARWKENP